MKLKNLFIIGLFLCTIVGCKNESETTPELKIDENDKESLKATAPTFTKLEASAVSSSIKVQGTKKTGNAPAPSDDFSAPHIYRWFIGDEVDEIRAAAGKTAKINVSVSGDIAGYYLQVEGSDEYYDIPASSVGARIGTGSKKSVFSRKTSTTNNARIASSNTIVIEIEVPASLQGGEFCVYYCVYNSEGLVSNTLKSCIQVQSIGGAGAEFLTSGEWAFKRAVLIYTEDGETVTENIEIGVLDIYNDTAYCYLDSKEYPYVNEDRYDYQYMRFTANGGFESEYKGYSKGRDYDVDVCENGLVLKEQVNTGSVSGAWSYNSATQTLTLLYESTDDESGYTSQYFEEYKVVNSGSSMALTNTYDTDYGDDYLSLVMYLDKK